MQILKKSTECYIQRCEKCGSVLKYSECDIHAKNKQIKTEDDQYKITTVCSFDSFVCPSCGEINIANREPVPNASIIDPLARCELEKAILGRGVPYQTMQLILSDFDARIDYLHSFVWK